MHYNPNTTTHLNARDNIQNAYALAGKPAPTRVDFLSARLAEEPTPYDLAVKYATQTLDADVNENTILEEAVTAITRAQAVEMFRGVYERTIDGIALERIDTMRDTAVKELTPAFTKTIKQLTTTASSLDENKPLSPETAFEQDTTADYKQAVDLIAVLAGYAAIHNTAATQMHMPSHIAKLLPIIHIEETVQERGQHHAGSFLSANHAALTPATHAVRALNRDASRDIDLALINIARNKYDGITLKLGTTADLATRTERVITALVREHDPRVSTNLVRVL